MDSHRLETVMFAASVGACLIFFDPQHLETSLEVLDAGPALVALARVGEQFHAPSHRGIMHDQPPFRKRKDQHRPTIGEVRESEPSKKWGEVVLAEEVTRGRRRGA